MRKSFFSILLCLILIPFTISAISLSEIENDPIRYVKVYEVMDETGCYYTGSMYVDKDSVEVLLCAPPLYTIRGKTYFIDHGAIIQDTRIINYDYNQSMKTITKRLILDNPKISRDELIKKYLDIIHINSGITYSETYSKMYNSDGTIALDNLPDIPPQKCGSFSGIGGAANYMFYKCYNHYFQL